MIAGQYTVDLTQPIAGAGGGLEAFAVANRAGARSGLMAVLSRPLALPRGTALNALASAQVDHLLTPVAHGLEVGPGGVPGWFVVCPLPPGPAIWPTGAMTVRPWTETELLMYLLRPAAIALAQLHASHLTHRAIRPDNIFRAAPGETVTLGNAWSAPPASLQSAVFEPPYSAVCLPHGRGDGDIADDVYALGVTLLCLATGQLPMADLDAEAIVARKLERGSFAALVGNSRLPPTIADLLTGMLAEDPEHRPSPAMLADPVAARARRVAARPPRRAQRSMDLGGTGVWTARTLAHAIGRAPEQGARMLRLGAIDTWLRRHLGDSGLAVRLEEFTRQRSVDGDNTDSVADMVLAARAVALLDPLAPLWWRGVALWPDGLGSVLVEAGQPGKQNQAVLDAIHELVDLEITSVWGKLRAERCDVAGLRADAALQRQLMRQRGWGGGLAALRYALNPMLPCASPLLAGQAVVRKTELLPALDAAAARPESRKLAPLDAEIAAFLVARQEPTLQSDLVKLTTVHDPSAAVVLQLRVLAGLQDRLHAPKLVHLAGWCAELALPAVLVWRSRTRREQVSEVLPQRAAAGNLTAMLRLIDDPILLAADARGAQAAVQAAETIDAELAALRAEAPARSAYAKRIGAELATALAVTGLTASFIMVALG